MKKLNSKQVIAIIMGIVGFVITSIGLEYISDYLFSGTSLDFLVFDGFGGRNWIVKIIASSFVGLVGAYSVVILAPRLFPPKEKKNKL
jgi:hypothetical protein